MAENGKIYTRKIIAQLLDISERHVKRLTDYGHLQEFSTGTYKLLPTVQSYIKYLRSQISDDDSTSDYNVEKAKLANIKREDLELTMKLRKNELHRGEIVEAVMVNMLTAFKAKQEALRHKLLPQLLNVPADCAPTDYFNRILKNALSEPLAELSKYSPEMFAVDSINAEHIAEMVGLDDE